MSAARLAKTAIKIPNRIERGPTDILKALAGTIKHIPKEPDFMIHDDPYLLPKNNRDQRFFVLSRLSGIRTARYFLKNRPEMFYRDDSEPKIEEFTPPEEFSSDMDLAEEDIKWCIEKNDIVNGLIAYKAMEEKGLNLSDEILLDFFELLCYTNEEPLPDFITRETENLSLSNQLVRDTWRVNGKASKIFNRIKEDLDPSRVYSSMISGLSKHNQHSTAQQVYEDFKANHPDKALYNNAYSSLLISMPKLHSSVSGLEEAINEIVNHMEAHSVAPDIDIFHAILHCYGIFNVDDATCEKAFKLVNDMVQLNIKPVLDTYGHLILIACKSRVGRLDRDIIDDFVTHAINAADLDSPSSHTSRFLSRAMFNVATRLNDLRLANKVHRIYLKNPMLIPNVKEKARYFNSYFKLIITTETLDNILSFYDAYVPNSFSPYPDVYEALGEALDLYKAPEETVRRIGRDIVNFKLALKIQNDAVFRKDPDYVAAIENSI